MQETQVWSLGSKGPLEKEMAAYSSILAWEIPWAREAWQAAVHVVARVQHNLVTKQQLYKFGVWHNDLTYIHDEMIITISLVNIYHLRYKIKEIEANFFLVMKTQDLLS